MIKQCVGGIRVDDETPGRRRHRRGRPLRRLPRRLDHAPHARAEPAEVLDRRVRDDWEARGSKDLYTEAREKARDIMRRAPARAASRRRRGRIRAIVDETDRARRRHCGRPASPEGGYMATRHTRWQEAARTAHRRAIASRSARSSRRCCTASTWCSSPSRRSSASTPSRVTAAYGGGQTFFWLGFLIIVYLIPYGMISPRWDRPSRSRAAPMRGCAWRSAARRLLHRRHLLGLEPRVDRRHAGRDERGGRSTA